MPECQGHMFYRRLLLYLEILGVSPAESLAISQKISGRKPVALSQVMSMLKEYMPPRQEPVYPTSAPPLNRQPMVTDKLSASDFFNDLEL
ncbi:MAG: hypothetical protein LBP22_04715 [Deltaproteobacteria bacterium]|nr:hypothetical protein [Deltaproteobacteria bacterium]